jgi:putative addiction module CopG family antidote
MNISLTPDLDNWVTEQVKIGAYLFTAEVICEALHLLQNSEAVKQQKLNSLCADIKQGIDDLDAGRYTVFNQNFVDDLLA